METFGFFLLTLLIAAAGGLLAWKLRMPAGAMVGAIAAVAVFGLLSGHAVVYPQVKTCAQLLSGAFIGTRITRGDVRSMRSILGPVCFLLVSVVILNVTCATVMVGVSSLDITTALFATAPGGMNDMSLIAVDYGANETYVALLQLFRIILIYLIMPPIFTYIVPALQRKRGKEMPAHRAAPAPSEVEAKTATPPRHYLGLVLCAAVGGLALYSLGVAAGAMIGSMLASTAYSIFVHPVHLDRKLRVGVQIICGAFIGTRIDMDSLLNIQNLLIPMVVMVVGVVLFVFVAGYIMHRVSKLDLITCMMACTPGGLQEMAMLSEELGADTPKIVIMQTARLMFVVMLFPVIIPLLSLLFTQWAG